MRLAKLALPLAVLMPLAAVPATDHPVRVTTDSVAYCTELSVRFDGQPGIRHPSVLSLAEEGRKLCETGYVRTGIAKLRRALRATLAGGG